MLGPRALGLPAFTNDNQQQRATRQIAKIGERLRARDRRMDWLVAGMELTELAGSVAGVAVGAGAIVKAGQVGGRMAVAKLVGGVVAFYAADQFAAKGLKAAGASDTTVNSLRFTLMVVGYILYRRRMRSGGRPTTVEEAPPSVKPPPSPSNAKPPLPPPQAQKRFSWPGHASAAAAEEELANTVHNLPDEAVVRWGDPIGTRGADVISVNLKTGRVTLW